MTPDLVVLVPVLNRPASVAPLVESWLDARTVDSRLVFICTPDDNEQISACALACQDGRTAFDVVDWDAGPGDFARKINHGFRRSTSPFVFQAADDVMFCPGWDREAMQVADVTGAGVVGTNDHGNPTVKRGQHSTHSLIRRSYVDSVGGTFTDGPGVVFHEGYGHQWVDTELVEAAKGRGQWAFAPRSAVCHDHPFWNRHVPRDATYDKGLASAAPDERLYRQRLRAWRQENAS